MHASFISLFLFVGALAIKFHADFIKELHRLLFFRHVFIMPKNRFADVFLSHHCASMNQHAAELDEKLRDLGINTFICTSMRPGDDFRQSITVNAVKCKIFVAFVNKHWAKSEECISEFNCALRGFNVSGSPFIMPIVIGGFGWIDVVKYPDAFNLTSNTNCAVLSGDNWDSVFDTLIDSIKGKLCITDKRNESSKLSLLNCLNCRKKNSKCTKTRKSSKQAEQEDKQVDML